MCPTISFQDKVEVQVGYFCLATRSLLLSETPRGNAGLSFWISPASAESYQVRPQNVYLWIEVYHVFCYHFACEDARCSLFGEAAWLS